MIRIFCATAVTLGLFLGASPLVAQQVHVTTPLVGATESFHERIGLDWGFRSSGPNGYLFFNRNGANSGIPTFGGYDPNAAATLGFGGPGFHFNLWASQGVHRTITSSAPSLVLPNGGYGYVRDVSARPFVVGVTPVVGEAISPVAERVARLRAEGIEPGEASLGNSSAADRDPVQETPAPTGVSSAERGDLSLSEIRRQRAAAEAAEDELRGLIDSARLAEAKGLYGAARVRYAQAARKATGATRAMLVDALERLKDR